MLVFCCSLVLLLKRGQECESGKQDGCSLTPSARSCKSERVWIRAASHDQLRHIRLPPYRRVEVRAVGSAFLLHVYPASDGE